MACKNCNCKKPGKLSIFWKKFKNIFNSYGQKVDVKTAAILLVKNGKIYLSKRSELSSYAGYWQFPGGKVEENESFETGALRELEEETGIWVEAARLEFISSDTTHPTSQINYIYRLDLRPGEIPEDKEPEKHDGWKLIDPEIALKLKLMPGIRGIVQKMVEENKKND